MTKEEAEKKYKHECKYCYHYTDDKRCMGTGRFNHKDETDTCKKWRIKHELCDWIEYIDRRRIEEREIVRRRKQYWHKIEEEGLPVVEGWYLCDLKADILTSYATAHFNGKFEWSDTDLSQFVIAWHKIKEYK